MRLFLVLAVSLLTGLPAAAQQDPWAAMVADADSIGARTPPNRIAPDVACDAVRADSVELAGGDPEISVRVRSLRTRGLWTTAHPPAAGRGRFSLREVRCREEDGRPLTFVAERDHRYFYLLVQLREPPTFAGLRFLGPDGRWERLRWDAASRTMRPAQ